MKKYVVLLTLSILLPVVTLFTAVAASPHERTRADFASRMELLGERGGLFIKFMDQQVGERDKEAYMFLLAYCPVCDIADMDPGYFLRQVRGAFRAREYFPWGESVPEEIFTHFVLPHRINNENLDEARDVFFEELKDRIKGLSMYDAALEVNHWCHEKVEYRATDARTSAPLALVKTSWGRCGEESAFTATALRAVGIPARQVYTPRWVHTDSNHAWVEVWVDGRWYYMGACEPEPELNMAWFTVPATRAMMMHTTVFGKYAGPEEVNHSTDLYTTINLMETYAPVRRVKVTVTDPDGRPVAGARVKFKVYNYSEFFPVATLQTGPGGEVAVTTGYGDILAWASLGARYGYVKIGTEADEATLVLDDRMGREYAEDFVMDVPAQQPVKAVESAKAAENRRRLAEEDSIRNAYMSTFADEDSYTRNLSVKTGLGIESTMRLLREAQGNWREIAAFMEDHSGHPYLEAFLESLNPKDLRDTPSEYLADHISDMEPSADEEMDDRIVRKILSPRIDMEIIAPWRSYLREKHFKEGLLPADPLALKEYVRNNIRVDDSQNYVACLSTPVGVDRTGIADRRSRNVYYVALCRTAGIPARIERATGTPQYWEDGLWHDVVFDDSEKTDVPVTGTITLTSDAANPVEPAYRTHYTIALFDDGDFRTLDLSRDLSGRGFPAEVEVPAGYYRFTSGSRANDGSVSVHTEYFNLPEDGRSEISVSLPATEGKLFVEGILDMNTVIFLPDGSKTTLKDRSAGEGLILVFADPATEPTRHVLQEMPAYSRDLEEWGGGILFVEQGAKGTEFNRSIFRDIPSQSLWITDEGGALLAAATESLRMEFAAEYPLILYLNTNGGILFSHKGYRLGLVESLWKTIAAERQMSR